MRDAAKQQPALQHALHAAPRARRAHSGVVVAHTACEREAYDDHLSKYKGRDQGVQGVARRSPYHCPAAELDQPWLSVEGTRCAVRCHAVQAAKKPWTPAPRPSPGLAARCMAAAHRSTFPHSVIRLACLLAAVAAVSALAAAAAPAPSMAAPTAATAEVQAQRARDAKVVPDVVDNLAPRRVDLPCLLLRPSAV